jgi:hypothetical protein
MTTSNWVNTKYLAKFYVKGNPSDKNCAANHIKASRSEPSDMITQLRLSRNMLRHYTSSNKNSVDTIEWKWVIFIDSCVWQVYENKYIYIVITQRDAFLEDNIRILKQPLLRTYMLDSLLLQFRANCWVPSGIGARYCSGGRRSWRQRKIEVTESRD